MSLRKKINQRVNNKATETQPTQSELFINLGFTIEIEGEPTFVNLPLTLTADRLDEVIERQTKSISVNSPNSWVELVEGRIALAEAVQALFNKLETGESVKADEIDPNNSDFGFLSGLEIQFTRRAPREEVETGAVRQSVLDKFRNR